jgi:ASC-1-like (ASCH) protein
MTHELKCHVEYFDAIEDGRKTFEIRRNDRGFAVGDFLLLRAYDPIADDYTGLDLVVGVTYITDYGQPHGQVVMGIKKVMVRG